SIEEKATILAKPDVKPLALPVAEDENGVRNKEARKQRRQARMSKWFYGDNIPLPSPEELAEAEAHLNHEIDETAAVVAEHEGLTMTNEGTTLVRHNTPE
ncbi:MAG TPA: hypothetical protein PLB21_12980, partial [Actinomycetota bacterium]|nr:hypothetical protein [Actinomycetota bacterium]